MKRNFYKITLHILNSYTQQGHIGVANKSDTRILYGKLSLIISMFLELFSFIGLKSAQVKE